MSFLIHMRNVKFEKKEKKQIISGRKVRIINDSLVSQPKMLTDNRIYLHLKEIFHSTNQQVLIVLVIFKVVTVANLLLSFC